VFQGVFLYFDVTERLYALFHLVAFRGLRRGEVAGLPWTDVDLEGGTIRIRETRPDGDFDPDDPKSEYGDRAVTLDAMTVVALDAWRTAQDKEKEEAASVWVDSGLVLTRQDGAPLQPEWISQRFDILLAQYAAIRQKQAEGWSVAQIARKHRADQAKVDDVLNGVPLPPRVVRRAIWSKTKRWPHLSSSPNLRSSRQSLQASVSDLSR
jgi:hypothetical protein